MLSEPAAAGIAAAVRGMHSRRVGRPTRRDPGGGTVVPAAEQAREDAPQADCFGDVPEQRVPCKALKLDRHVPTQGIQETPVWY